MLDVKRLIAEVAAQNGIRLEPDDPAFALVTLNQLVLEETANRLYGHISTALAQFTESLSKGERFAGKTLAQEVKAVAIEVRKEWATDLHEMQSGSAVGARDYQPEQYVWLAGGVLLGVMLMVTGFGLYRMLVG